VNFRSVCAENQEKVVRTFPQPIENKKEGQRVLLFAVVLFPPVIIPKEQFHLN